MDFLDSLGNKINGISEFFFNSALFWDGKPAWLIVSLIIFAILAVLGFIYFCDDDETDKNSGNKKRRNFRIAVFIVCATIISAVAAKIITFILAFIFVILGGLNSIIVDIFLIFIMFLLVAFFPIL